MEYTEEYPRLVPDESGYKVQINKGAYLPGIYLTHIMATKAMLKYLGQRYEASLKRKSKSKS